MDGSIRSITAHPADAMALAQSGFSFGARVELVVRDYRRALLSVPALTTEAPLGEKNLLAAGPASVADKCTLEEHLQHLLERGLLTPERPLLALGMRNTLVNLRCPAIIDGRLHAVDGEEPQRSRRPYFGIGARDGQLALGLALGDAPQDWSSADFFCAAVPVYDDRLDAPALLDAILTEASDHSHIFDLPRGNHPQATDETRAAWSRLHETFLANLYADRPQAVAAMRAAVQGLNPGLRRCVDYLHAVLGVGAAGELCCVFAHGRLESVGRMARQLGAERAVCVENSGSIMPTCLLLPPLPVATVRIFPATQ